MPDLLQHPSAPPPPEVLVSSSDVALQVARDVAKGKLRKLGSRVYSPNLTDYPQQIILRNIWALTAALLPDALICDRTALDNRPASDGSVFLISRQKRDIRLPGVTLRPRSGRAPLESDPHYIGGLRIASPARAWLENMRPSRARSGVARTLSCADAEERLDELLRIGGERALLRLRDQARAIAPDLAMEGEFVRFDLLIGSLLGTRAAALESPLAIARAAGEPYDPHRVELFQLLHAELSRHAPALRPAKGHAGPVLPFYESYFSNFIEGTEFALDDAVKIVFEGQIPRNRPADAHDLLGTWKVAANPKDMARLPRSFEDLTALLEERHAKVMEGRPDRRPGIFKTEANRAGSTSFVAPDLVKGTLRKGFEIYGY